MVTFTITIQSLKTTAVDNLPDVVREVLYHIRVEEGANSLYTTGSIVLPSPDAANFIPFEQLTEAQVIQWLENEPSVQRAKVNLEAALVSKIESESLTPKMPPWAALPPELPPSPT